MRPNWGHPHPQPSSKIITTLQQALGNHRLHNREAAFEKPKGLRARHVSADSVSSCHSEAAGIKRNWDSSSASYASRPWHIGRFVYCTKMAQVCKLSDDIEILTHFAIRQESMLDCSFFLFVNYDIDDSESDENRDSMHVPRPTRETGQRQKQRQRQCSALLWASPPSPMRAHFP
jgi:hypothetical protein